MGGANRQTRVIRQDGADTYQHRIVLSPQDTSVLAGFG
jgi:hypothetical protein